MADKELLQPLQIIKTSPKLPSPSKLSPVTDLTLGLGELSTHSYHATPKRRISWSSTSTVSSCSPASVCSRLPSFTDQGFYDTPTTIDSPMFLDRLLKEVPNQQNVRSSSSNSRTRSELRRFNSLPVPFDGFSPLPDKENIPSNSLSSLDETTYLSPSKDGEKGVCIEDHDSNSHDSGYSGSHMDKDDVTKIVFVEPLGLPPRRLRLTELEYPRGERRHSVPVASIHGKVLMPRPEIANSQNSVSKSSEDGDDGFLEVFENDPFSEDSQLSSSLTQLIQGPLSTHCEVSSKRKANIGKRNWTCLTERDENIILDTPKLRNVTRGLFPSKEESEVKVSSFKHPEPPKESPVTHLSKRRKAVSFCTRNSCNQENNENKPMPKRVQMLQRCHSETEATIMRALQRSSQDPDLIGDFSRPFSLPLVCGKHQDLKSIHPNTVEQLITGQFTEIEEHVIVDCRYPYEFEAGHIKGAVNIYTKEGIMERFLRIPPKLKDPSKRRIVIFHCEFSSERGPNLSRFLRNKDREANKDCYPALHYPEIYLLNGGYKAFFEHYQDLCEPPAYKPMLHKDHENDLKHFRAKSKSWNGEAKSSRVAVRPGLKF